MAQQVEHWHLKKEVPIALIVTLIVYLVTAVWFSAALTTRVTHTEMFLDKVESKAEMALRQQSELLERLARIEERTGAQLQIMQRMERLIFEKGKQ